MNSYYRVWPDGTIQDHNEYAYTWMSDDFIIIAAFDEEDAYQRAIESGLIND